MKIHIIRSWFNRILILLLLVISAVGVWLYNPLPSNPSSKVLAEGANLYRAEIVRDEWGVPHIRGKRDADASFGLAYAHAEDDFQTIQETVAATRGVLAQYRGSVAAPTDYIVALLDVWGTVDNLYDTDVPNDVKAIAEAYAAGLNLYASRYQDATWRGLAPFTAKDVIAGFVFKTPFFYGLDKTLLALYSDDRKVEIALAPSSNNTAWQVTNKSGAALGSNAIAVSAKRSDDAATRLLINSHQPMTGPVAWYEAHIQSEQGLDIMGGIFPGTPVILHGFNRNLGWANTVNHIDLADTYVLTRNPDKPHQYRLDGQWLDLEVQEIVIDVKLFGPFMFKAKRDVYRSVHGPVVESGRNLFALRYAGMGEIRQLEQYYRFNQAQNFAEFIAAMKMNALPSINYVYADHEDNIAFIHNAQYPNRLDSWNWQHDLPGDRSELIWQGYRSFDQMPKLINPESGLLFNANNTPYSATDGQDNLTSVEFPQSMGLAVDQTNRSLRLLELTENMEVVGKAELLRLKFDDDYSVNSKQYQGIQTIVDMDWSDQPELEKAAKHLRGWDRSMHKDSRYAALAGLTLSNIYQQNKDDYTPAALQTAFSEAVTYLLEYHGQIDPPWGDVNRLERGDVDLPLDGSSDVLRAIYSLGLDNDDTYATHGDTWMAIVEWSAGGELHADVLHQFGSATLDKSSPHYADQAPLFAEKRWRKAEFDIDRLKQTVGRVTQIGGLIE